MNDHTQTATPVADLSAVEFVLLDCYGTQIKSWTSDEVRNVQALLDHRFTEGEAIETAVDPRLRRLLDTTNIADSEQFLKLIASQLRAPPVTQETLDAFNELLARVRCCTSEFKDVLPFLRGARRKGLRLGIISNGWVFGTSDIFYGKDRFHRFFEVMVLSHEVGFVKPEPQIFEAALAKIRLAPDKILVVGDDEELDIYPALRAGMRAVHVDRLGRFHNHIPGAIRVRQLTDLLPLLPVRRTRRA